MLKETTILSRNFLQDVLHSTDFYCWTVLFTSSFGFSRQCRLDNCCLLFMNIFIPYESVEITNKMQPCNRIYYSNVYWRLNMFRAAYRSSLGAPNCICSLWFIYTCGDRPLWSLSGTQNWERPVTTCVRTPEAANTVLEHLKMSGMPLETCWAFNKFCNNKFYYKVASCWLFLLIHTTMHGSMNIKFIPYFLSNKSKSLSKIVYTCF